MHLLAFSRSPIFKTSVKNKFPHEEYGTLNYRRISEYYMDVDTGIPLFQKINFCEGQRGKCFEERFID